MKNVMIIVPYMSGYGGTETVIKNLFMENSRKKQNIMNFKLVSVGGYRDNNWISDIPNKEIIQFYGGKKLRKLQYMVFLPFIMFFKIKKYNPDTIISTNPIIWTLAFFYKKILKGKYQVFSWYHYSLKDKPLKSIFLKKADKFLAISSGIKRQLIAKGIPEDNIKLVYNPILRKKGTIERTEGKNTIKLAYIGRIMLDGQKNMRQLVDALTQVSVDWKLDVYGEGDIELFRKYISKKKINKNIQIHGFKKNVWSEFKKMDAIVLTSKYEGLPMVLNEAISMGIPVVSSNCETGPDDIINRNNGLIYNLESTADLVRCLNLMALKKNNFKNIMQIKESINKFYSDVFFNNFLRSMR